MTDTTAEQPTHRDRIAETPRPGPRTLAYSSAQGVICVECPRPAGAVPLTVHDVEQQGRCASCGRYVVDVVEGYANIVDHTTEQP